MKMNADTDSLCNWCGNPGSIPCGCGWEGCYETLCESCAAKPIPGRRFVDGGEKPVLVVPGVTNTGYALLTEEERQHVRSGTAYVVKRHFGGGWKVAVQRLYGKIYWHPPSSELLARLPVWAGWKHRPITPEMILEAEEGLDDH